MSTEEQNIEVKGGDSITQFYEKNKNNLMIAGIALILLAGGIYYYTNTYKPQLEVDANDSFFMAERYFGQDSLDKALNGDGLNLGMIELADDYGSTKVGNQARYYAGRILLTQGKFDEALDYLDDVDMDGEIMPAQVLVLRGDCYAELEKYSKAGDVYMKAANARSNDLTTPYALHKAGIIYEEAGEYSDAITAYKRLESEYSNSSYAQKVTARIARAEAKKANAK